MTKRRKNDSMLGFLLIIVFTIAMGAIVYRGIIKYDHSATTESVRELSDAVSDRITRGRKQIAEKINP